jgi:hypothetical protein
MDQLTKYLISELIDGRKVTAVYGGEFKPPTKEHFNLVKKTLEDNKQIDKVIVYVGDKAEEGITQEQSLQVWGLFKEMLGDKIEIIPSNQPLNDIKTYIKDNPNDINIEISFDKGLNSIGARKALKSRNKEKFLEYLPEEMPDTEKESVWSVFEDVILKEGDPKVGTGKKPKGSGRRLYTDEDPTDTVAIKFSSKQDIIDTLSKTSFKSKPHNRQSQIINVIHQRVRAAYERAKDPEVKARLKKALEYAEQRKEASKEKTERLNKENVAPNHTGKAAPFGSGYKPLKENTIPSINIIQKCAELTQHMIDKGYNIRPLPLIKFIDDDVENAGNFLGKTAYYKPEDKMIVLYTYGRHPKDIVRSFAHEMIHHMQNLEGRIGNGDIKTTNTNEDDYLKKIEAEANLKGTMTFRNWTDSLREDGKKVSIKNMDNYKKQNNPSGKVKDPFGLNQYARELTIGLQEVGEATLKPYEWEEYTGKEGYYNIGFMTDYGLEYDVDLELKIYTPENSTSNIQAIEIGFAITAEDEDGYSYSTTDAVVNKGEMYRVMSTIIDILKVYIKKLKAEAIIYSPSKKQGEEFGSQRDNLYKAFISKAFPGVKFEQKGDIVAVILPKTTLSENKDPFGLNQYARELAQGLEETT